MSKKRKKLKRKKNNIKKNILLFLLAIGILLIISLIAKSADLKISQIAQTDSLQLKTFNPAITSTAGKPAVTNPPRTTLPPTSAPIPKQEVCPDHTGKRISNTCMCGFIYIVCKNQKCADVKHEQTGLPINYGCEEIDKNRWCEPPFANEGDGNYCLAKPIVYLYPKVPTFVDVRVESIGTVIISEPHYPTGGWKKVLAYPNGNLWYQGGQYRELFYETDVEDFAKPVNGINIPKEKVEPELKRILTLLGLNEFERKEFMDFWVPILESQDKPYIQFSLIQGAAKDEIDKVIINPKPDTFIEILAYFKPLDIPFQGDALILPNEPPKRIGFTAVEWGGVIDYK